MSEMIGYMLTWTTYGTWLQGDGRGWVKDGNILEGSEGLLLKNSASMKQQAVSLNKEQRKAVQKAIGESAKGIGQEVLAITVRSNHVHAAVMNIDRPIGKIVQRYKRDATYSVREFGVEGRVWTKGYDVRYCYDWVELQSRIEYVNNHGD